MSTWILVLTLGMADYRAGFAIHSVPGFRDRPACVAAAEAWLAQTRATVAASGDVGSRSWRPAALCVEQQR